MKRKLPKPQTSPPRATEPLEIRDQSSNGNCEFNARRCVVISVTKMRPTLCSLATRSALNALRLTMLSDNVLLRSWNKRSADDSSRRTPESYYLALTLGQVPYEQHLLR